MKTICTAVILLFTTLTGPANKPVSKVDLNKFSGKWYSLYSIPTMFDKGTRETTTTYTLNADGYYNVVTVAKKGEDNVIKTYKSKLFPDKEDNGAEMKAQFIWPIKVDYWVIDIADDYSYAVVGHPDHKFLFIMSRKPSIPQKEYEEIISRCKAMGYPVEKLVSQQHKAG
ncbi:apolipoprotein D and lipocalin family protein [Mucilaginibacter pineti]|uniref:Apolipoprotein D and lipocalin family protein n=1 Tax=Mucilaginibacter pineti TaxID=1391627 RepID=A0A1G7AX81_9SPHI|nr:lipocalin family protein [Mucilaginibacter pineti]SDE19488.1 apolipoprotein D and lipocalin family protein [Mucilaginibacter pineti]